jgi:hypothetical protein
VRIIEITVDAKGQSKVETRGFTGGECREAGKFIEQALRQRIDEKLTAEFHQGQTTDQRLKQSSCFPIPLSPTSLSPDFQSPKGELMTLDERLSELVRAAFAGIWVQSFEHDDSCVRRVSVSTPERTRTSNPQFRRLMLYPIELRVPVKAV